MSEPFRCSSLALSLDEPLYGTASTIRNWVLLEQPGPWGYHAPAQSGLAKGVARKLIARARSLGIRVVLLRRHGRQGSTGRHCFFAHTGHDVQWMEHLRIDDPADLLRIDLAPLGDGKRLGVGRETGGPLYLVCTNGRRDPCCAERGRPVARALAQHFGDQVWECSHIGGDRFAGNVVCFPHGLYFGHVGAREAVDVAMSYGRGVIDLDHYRGRSSYDFAVQAAEYFLRREEGLRHLDDLRLAKQGSLADGAVTARFLTRTGSALTVRVRVSRSRDARPLTCHVQEGLRPRSFEFLRAR